MIGEWLKGRRGALSLEGQIKVVLGNESADLDSVATSLAVSFLEGDRSVPWIPIPRKEFSLRKDLLYFFQILSIEPDDLLFLEEKEAFFSLAKEGRLDLVLVDHNALKDPLSDCVVEIIDHHKDEAVAYPKLKNRMIEKTGSTASLVVRTLIKRKKTLPKDVALLLLAPLLEDTSNLQDPFVTTTLDREAAAKLFEIIGESLPEAFYKTLREKKGEVDLSDPFSVFQKDYKEYSQKQIPYGISSLLYLHHQQVEVQEAWIETFFSTKKIALFFVLKGFLEGRELMVYTPNEALFSKIQAGFQEDETFFRLERKTSKLAVFTLPPRTSRKTLQPLLHQLLTSLS